MEYTSNLTSTQNVQDKHEMEPCAFYDFFGIFDICLMLNMLAEDLAGPPELSVLKALP
jgi:hypothetical protein